MNSLFDSSPRFLEWVWKTSWQASILVLLVLAVQWLWRDRLAPRWRYGLWLLVVGRLALPVSFQSEWSLFNWVQAGQPRSAREVAAAGRIEPPQLAVNPSRSAPEEPAWAGKRESAVLAAKGPELAGTPLGSMASAKVAGPPAGVSALSLPPPGAGAQSSPPMRGAWRHWLLWWLAGAAAVAGRLLWEYARLAWAVRRARVMDSPALLTVLAECRARMGVQGPEALWETALIGSPALYGVWRPRLLLPAALVDRLTLEEWRQVFLHELAHHRRRDALGNWILAGLQVLHWFNPVIWLGFSRMRADRELACDALVLATTGPANAKAYGRTIVKVLEHISTPTTVPGLVGLLEDKRQVARRLRMIVKYRPGTRWSWWFAAGLAALGVICLSDAVPREGGAKEGDSPVASMPLPMVENEAVLAGTGEGLSRAPRPAATESNVVYFTARAVDGNTGVGVGGAKVHSVVWIGGSILETQGATDPDGSCKVAIPDQAKWLGRIAVTIQHPDYAAKFVELGLRREAGSGEGAPAFWFPQVLAVELEKGEPIGGRVRDERDRPVVGAQVYITYAAHRDVERMEARYSYRETIVDGRPLTNPYRETNRGWKPNPVATTDREGRWSYAHFPSGVTAVQLEVVRADGSRQLLGALKPWPIEPLVEYSVSRQQAETRFLNELRQTKAKMVLRAGVALSGRVVDVVGKPVAGAMIQISHGGVYPRMELYRVDGRGRFLLPHRVERQVVLTASAGGFASVSRTVELAAKMGEVTVTLPEMKPLRAQVVDTEGQPVAGATLSADARENGGRIPDWTGKTGADGRVAWSNAPSAEATYWVKAEGYRPLCAPLAGGRPEEVLTLIKKPYPDLTYWINLEDADTHQPLDRFTVSRWHGENGYEKEIDGARGQARFRVNNPQSIRRGQSLRFTAEGYEPADSPPFRVGSDRVIRVAMRKAQPIQGVVLSPEKRPLADVEIRVKILAGGLSLSEEVAAPVVETYRSDADGRYLIPLPGGDKPVIFKHAQGVLVTSVEALRRSSAAQLQPWGRLEGQFKVRGQNGAFETITLVNLNEFLQCPCHVLVTAFADGEGRFHFDNLPAGEYRLCRELCPGGYYFSQPAHALSPQPVVVKSGETTSVVYGGGGRLVGGRLEGEPFGKQKDQTGDFLLLELKLPEPTLLNSSNSVQGESDQGAPRRFDDSEEELRDERARRTYFCEVDFTGAFRAEDVPPGKYWLKSRRTVRGVTCGTAPAETLLKEVVVPQAPAGREDEPVDLGSVAVTEATL